MPGDKGASCGQTVVRITFKMEWNKSITPHILSEDFPVWQILDKASSRLASARAVLLAGMNWIFTLGVRPEAPFYQIKNLALINRVSFASLLLALPGSFLLLLAGFGHTFSLLISGLLILSLILAFNGTHHVQWAQALFAYSPAVTIMFYTWLELSSGSLTDPLTYILARQGLCLALLLPVMIYGFDRSRKWAILCVSVILFLIFDLFSGLFSGTLISDATGMSKGLFSVLSVLQVTGMAFCVLYVQGLTVKHEQQVSKSNEKLHSMVVHDGMTGLFNHSFMEQVIGDAINRSKRSKTPLSLLMIDVDSFKKINDSYGHNTGDDVLKYLAKLLESNKRSTDYLGRWGGDELVMLLTDTNLQGAVNLAEKLRSLVERQTLSNDRQLTISLGASEYNAPDDVGGFIGRADAAMYRAKRGGRNRVASQKPAISN
jgi:diguanylate cyclase (GGDEF)-like protein